MNNLNHPGRDQPLHNPAALATLDTPPAALIDADHHIHYGRFDQPILDPRIDALGRWCRIRTKRWHYTSVTLSDHFIAIALADLGFAAHAFVYVAPISRITPVVVTTASAPETPPTESPAHGAAPRRQAIEHASLAPAQAVRAALRMAPSSIGGASVWRRRGEHISKTWRPADAQPTTGRRPAGVGSWRVELDWILGGQRMRGDVVIERPSGTQCLALAHPVSPSHPAYTHKGAGLSARVDLHISATPGTGADVAVPLPARLVGEGVATIDWTIGWMARDTTWKWASSAWITADGQRAGLNLSAEVYEDADGHGRENALWLDGRVFPLRGVSFQVPAQPTSSPWHIRSLAGDTVDLTFEPHGAREEALNAGVIVSRFVQPYGTFSGHVRIAGGPQLRLNNVFGVVEDHVSRW